MAFNGSGTFAPFTPGNPVVAGTVISDVAFNATMTDLAAGLTNTLTRDGQSPPTQNLPMGGKKHTGLSAGIVAGDSLRFEQLFSQGAPAALPSAATVDIGGVNSVAVEISGTTTITSFGVNYNGPRFLRFTGALILTHSATLSIPGAANITTVAGDTCIAYPNSAANGWNVTQYQRAAGIATTSGVPTIQVISANGTYTAPAGLRMATVELVGGGGGGSGAAASDRGNGGGGGGYGKRLILAASIGASQAVTIGAAGAAGAAGANVGAAGGTTSFGALLSATGGGGGVTGGTAGGGALGGLGASGDINLRGGAGGNAGLVFATPGGNSMLGTGGAQVIASAGSAGNLYGGGGSGGDGSGAAARAGGAGAAGVVVVTEFY